MRFTMNLHSFVLFPTLRVHSFYLKKGRKHHLESACNAWWPL